MRLAPGDLGGFNEAGAVKPRKPFVGGAIKLKEDELQ